MTFKMLHKTKVTRCVLVFVQVKWPYKTPHKTKVVYMLVNTSKRPIYESDIVNIGLNPILDIYIILTLVYYMYFLYSKCVLELRHINMTLVYDP